MARGCDSAASVIRVLVAQHAIVWSGTRRETWSEARSAHHQAASKEVRPQDPTRMQQTYEVQRDRKNEVQLISKKNRGMLR